MPPVEWAAIVSAAGILVSIVGSAMVVSYRVGKVEAELRSAYVQVQQNSTTALQAMTERLARIEGMFELRLKDSV